MNITIDQTVSYDVKDVAITNILLSNQNDKLFIMSPYQWKDSTGKVIRTGNNRYSETDLLAKGISSDVITILKTLVPTEGTSGNCNIFLKDIITATKGYSGFDENGKGKWFSETLTEEQLLTAISPLTKQNVLDMVASFTTAIFT
jgi:hypothetical protein